MSKRIAIIHNPAAGQDQRALLTNVTAALLARGADVVLLPTSKAGDAETIGRGIKRGDFDILAIAGGDGTLQEVVNGASAETPPLAMVPMGTANVVAFEMGLIDKHGMCNSAMVAHNILEGRARKLSIGSANGRRFVFTAGVGLDAQVVADVSSRLKKYIGKVAFAVAAVGNLMNYGFDDILISADGQTVTGVGVIILNGRCYAGPYELAPDNDLSEPGLSVLVLKKPGRWAALSYLISMARSTLHERDDVVCLSNVRAIDITGPVSLAYQLDGEAGGHLPLKIKADAAQVQMIA